MNVSEIFSKLQSSLSNVASTQGLLETAQINFSNATQNYQAALDESTKLRTLLDDALNAQMGKTDNRVRVD